LLSIPTFNKIVTALQKLVGDIDYVRFFQRRRTTLGYAYVVFKDEEAAAIAKEALVGQKFVNKVLRNTDVQFASVQGVEALHTQVTESSNKFLYVNPRIQDFVNNITLLSA
jgi:RNA recognition motif-containing protein